jgi:alkylation response protein AidB-like acyl-CoA dehydrogenase
VASVGEERPFSREFPALDAAIASLSTRLRPTTAEREKERELLHEPVRELVDAGLTALRVPVEHGGLGGSLLDLTERLIALASVDPNLAHVFRGHIGFVELLRLSPESEQSALWFKRAASALVGNAQSERIATSSLESTLTRRPEGLVVNGSKFYTTGSIYSRWILLSADLDGEYTTAVVDAQQPGVRIVDDWDGFGQPLTGSGSSFFTDAVVDPDGIYPGFGGEEGTAEFLAGVFQTVLLAVLAGIGDAALRDAVAFVRPRRRLFGYAAEALPREDVTVQGVVGGLSASADAARRLVLSAAAELDAAQARGLALDPAARTAVFEAAARDVFRVQQVVPRLVLDAASELFEVGGASAVSAPRALDRHWRNARTVASHNPLLQRRRALGEWELNGTHTTWGRTHASASAAEASPAAPAGPAARDAQATTTPSTPSEGHQR